MDNQITLTIQSPDLAAAINNLAAALSKKNPPAVERTEISNQNVAPTQPSANVAAPSANAAVPVTPPTTPAPVATVPTAAPQYTLEMLATAGSALVDAGKLDQLVGLLSRYGVDSLTSLAPENYGAVANELRALGARI